MANNIGLFFNTSKNTRSFAEVLAQVQEYLASKYSTLITDNPEEQRQQITAYKIGRASVGKECRL